MDELMVAAASALVGAMATDGWNEVRSGVAALWRRVHPDRVPAIESELDEVRYELLDSRRTGDAEVEKGLVADWQRKLRRLMAAHPELTAELRLLLEEWSRLLPSPGLAGGQTFSQAAVVTACGKVNQVGRDQFIIGR
jgi:hypothetical protein